MRHRKSGRKLNRNSSHRKALMMNLSNAAFEHGIIKTTLPKAKELRRVVEPLITLAKIDSVANRRHAFKTLRSKDIVGKLFSEIGPASKDRNGGYTRILKCGYRKDDAAPMAYFELVDRQNSIQDNANQETDEKKASAPKVENTSKKSVIVDKSKDVKKEGQQT